MCSASARKVVHLPPTRLKTTAPGGTCLPFDPVVPGDKSGLGGIMPRQRADAGKRVDDLAAINRDVREDVANQLEEVLDLPVRAHRVLGHVGVHIGGSHQDPVPHGVDQDNPAVGVFKEDLPAFAGVKKLRVVQHDVGSLGAAHKGRRRPHGLVGQVNPCAGGVDDDIGGEVKELAGEFVTELDGAARCRAAGPGRRPALIDCSDT